MDFTAEVPDIRAEHVSLVLALAKTGVALLDQADCLQGLQGEA